MSHVPRIKVLPRANWTGSQHQSRGVACSDCHNVHAPDQKVLSKATQADVCFRVSQGAARAGAAHLRSSTRHAGWPSTRKMACSDCHNPHGSSGSETARQELGQRHLLHMPRGKARAVPLGARAGGGRLHELPHAARVQQRAAAQGASALALPGVP